LPIAFGLVYNQNKVGADGKMVSQYLTFLAGGRLWGIEIPFVLEVVRKMEVISVDLVPPFVSGLMNLRGRIVTVVDLCVRLGIPSGEEGNNCLVLNPFVGEQEGSWKSRTEGWEDSKGLRVDKVIDIYMTDRPCVPSCQVVPRDNGRFLQGVVETEGGLLGILNVAEIVSLT
jgi:purine-binding chemotaxis protein CheW